MATNFLLSQEFSALVTVFGLLGDTVVLILMIYTLHITAIARKLELAYPSHHASTFWGETISFTMLNKSLHAMPIQSVFVMKKHNGDFYMIRLMAYDDPEIIES